MLIMGIQQFWSLCFPFFAFLSMQERVVLCKQSPARTITATSWDNHCSAVSGLQPTPDLPFLHPTTHLLCPPSFHLHPPDRSLPCCRCQTSQAHSGSIERASWKRSFLASTPRGMHSRWRLLSGQDLKAILLARFVPEFFCIEKFLLYLVGLLCCILLSSVVRCEL